MSRPRAMVVTGVLGVVAGVLVFLLVLQVAGSGNVDINLGDDEFRVGRARALADPVAKDGPLLFQDLRGGDLDIYVQHTGTDVDEGWIAFGAQAPGAARRCQLRWERGARRFTDPCSTATYPADGEGLRQYSTRVEDGSVIVDMAGTAEDGGEKTR